MCICARKRALDLKHTTEKTMQINATKEEKIEETNTDDSEAEPGARREET